MLRLNPYAAVLKRSAILTAQRRQCEKEIALAEKRGVSVFVAVVDNAESELAAP